MTVDFLVFHRTNPHIFEIFCRICNALRMRGVDHYSARTVIDVVRFWHDISVDKGDSEFKIANAHSPYYARLYHHLFDCELFHTCESEADELSLPAEWRGVCRDYCETVQLRMH
jgi:hypothetical protein